MSKSSKARCVHGRAVCSECVVITDAARRVSDAVSLAIVFHTIDELMQGWLAFTLADGYTDHILYPSKASAVAHVSNEFHYFYVCMRSCLGGMPQKDAQLFIEVHREAYDAGMRISDPDAPSLIMPLSRGVGPWPR